MLKVALVAGEASGDILGAGLMRELKKRCSDIHFEGIAGPHMMAEGMESLVPMERLSVMGLVEVLGRLRELLGVRKSLRQRWLENPPDVFIGIDAPDFNLRLEGALKAAGIATVHYVSPSVWAWRRGRIKKIVRSTDLMLCLLPFEPLFYQEAGLDARFIGHTLADELPLEVDVQAAREALGLAVDKTWVALLPGSRGGEVDKLAPVFIDTVRWLLQRQPDWRFVLPAANSARREQIEALLAGTDLPVTLVDGRSREVMAASDVVLMASGTATLEGMLLKKPLVVAYKMAPLTFRIIKSMAKVEYVSLPNLLAKEALVPELLQDDASAEKLGPAVLQQLLDEERHQHVVERFTDFHRQLKLNADREAAKAVMDLLVQRGRLLPREQNDAG